MFKRLELETWHEVLPAVGFALTAAVFLVAIARALMLKREDADRLAALPLDTGRPQAQRPKNDE